MINRFLRVRLRFIASLVLMGLSALSFELLDLAKKLSLLEKILISYNVFQWTYLLSLVFIIFTTSYRKAKEEALAQDESANFVLGFSSIASVLTLITIAFELSSAKEAHGLHKSLHLALPAITLIGVWVLLPTMFAIHYAHLYYQTENEEKRPLQFPDKPMYPDYFDFLYFSVTISLASQTADIAVHSKRGRRLVLIQSILSFIFNTSVLAFGINVAASLLN